MSKQTSTQPLYKKSIARRSHTYECEMKYCNFNARVIVLKSNCLYKDLFFYFGNHPKFT